MSWIIRARLARICEHQRRKPACASAQSNQRIWYSFSEKYGSQTCSIQNVKILASLCSWADWHECYSFRNPDDVEAHIQFNNWGSKSKWVHGRTQRRYMTFRWRADDGPFIGVSRSSIPSSTTTTTTTTTKNVIKIWTPLWQNFLDPRMEYDQEIPL